MKPFLKTVVLGIALLTSTLAIAAHSVLLVVLPGCRYCSEAESLLDNAGVKYRTTTGNGSVPRLYVDGKYQGTGVDAVQSWLKAHSSR